MVILDYLRLLVLFGLCIAASYTDIKEGKISNRLICYALVFDLAFNALAFILGDVHQLIPFLTNTGLMISISLFLYKIKVWAGGDSKLLCVLALLYPPEFYWSESGKSPSFFVAVGFMFSCGFVFLVADSIRNVYRSRSWSIDFIRRKFIHTAVRYAQTSLILYTINLVYQFIIIRYVVLPELIFSCVCICIVYLIQDIKIFYNKKFSITLLAVIVLLSIFFESIRRVPSLLTYAIVLGLMVIRIFVEQYNYATIPTANVKPGMILSRFTTALFEGSRVRGLPEMSDETLRSRLTQDQVDSIIRWGKTKKGTETVVIVRKVPFAVFISLGLLLYFLLRVVIF